MPTSRNFLKITTIYVSFFSLIFTSTSILSQLFVMALQYLYCSRFFAPRRPPWKSIGKLPVLFCSLFTAPLLCKIFHAPALTNTLTITHIHSCTPTRRVALAQLAPVTTNFILLLQFLVAPNLQQRTSHGRCCRLLVRAARVATKNCLLYNIFTHVLSILIDSLRYLPDISNRSSR